MTAFVALFVTRECCLLDLLLAHNFPRIENTTTSLGLGLPELVARQAPFPVGLYLKQEPAKCQDFVARYTDDGVRSEVDSPICNTSTKILVRQSKSPEDREIGRRFAPLWEVFVPKLQEFSLNEMSKVLSLSPHLTSAHKSIAFSIAEIELGIEFSNLHHPDTNICLT